eukprot:45514_1
MAYRLWTRLKEWYRVGYLRRPYRFAFATMYVKSTIADIISQNVLEKIISHKRKAKHAGKSGFEINEGVENEVKNKFDFKRMIRFGSWGGLYCGFVEHWIYNVQFTKLWPQPVLMSAFKKMLCDLLIHTPFLYFPVYYVTKSLILGGTVMNGLRKYKTECLTVNIECAKFVIPVQLCVFYLVPIPFRLITMGFVGLFWMSYLSFLSPMIDEENYITQDQIIQM